MKEIFVTYRWENIDHVSKVISFVDYLRNQGYDAEVDQFLSQKETAIDFIKMMHKVMTEYQKVIIVLSEGYKERADRFTGGVGKEYGLIIKDIEDNPKKYILVSFNGVNDEIVPLNFKGREIVDLSRADNFNLLHAKLQEVNLVEFSSVRKEKPIVQKKEIQPFELTISNTKVEILEINVRQESTGTTSGKIRNTVFVLSVGLRNSGNKSVSDYTVEVGLPRLLTEYQSWGRVENNITIYCFNDNPKIFPKQEIRLKEILLKIRNDHASLAEESTLFVKVFSDDIFIEREFKIMELAYKEEYGQKRNLTKDDFLS